MARPQRVVEFKGQRKTMREWCSELGVNPSTLRRRIQLDRPIDVYAYCGSRGQTREYLREMWPGARDRPFAEDAIAQAAVNELGPMTLAEIGRCLGVGRSRVEQIERVAIAKIRDAEGPSGARRVLDMLEQIEQMRERREYVYPAPVEHGSEKGRRDDEVDSAGNTRVISLRSQR